MVGFRHMLVCSSECFTFTPSLRRYVPTPCLQETHVHLVRVSRPIGQFQHDLFQYAVLRKKRYPAFQRTLSLSPPAHHCLTRHYNSALQDGDPRLLFFKGLLACPPDCFQSSTCCRQVPLLVRVALCHTSVFFLNGTRWRGLT